MKKKRKKRKEEERKGEFNSKWCSLLASLIIIIDYEIENRNGNRKELLVICFLFFDLITLIYKKNFLFKMKERDGMRKVYSIIYFIYLYSSIHFVDEQKNYLFINYFQLIILLKVTYFILKNILFFYVVIIIIFILL